MGGDTGKHDRAYYVEAYESAENERVSLHQSLAEAKERIADLEAELREVSESMRIATRDTLAQIDLKVQAERERDTAFDLMRLLEHSKAVPGFLELDDTTYMDEGEWLYARDELLKAKGGA